MFLAEEEEKKSFAVGHLALGYVLGKASAALLKKELSIPVIFALSVIPDIDMLIPFVEHRGPVHSVVATFIVFVPVFVILRKKAVPYFLALIQHSLIGDYLTGGRIQLLWPVMTEYFGIEMGIRSQTNILMEWILFLVSISIMFMTKDITKFFQPHNSNLVLAIPAFTVLLPTLLSFPLDVPAWLIPPHLVFMFMFLASIFISLSKVMKKSNNSVSS